MKIKLMILSLAFLLVYCKTKKSSTETKTVKKTVTVSRPLEIAQKRWPDATAAELAEGKAIFEGKCTKCHEAKVIPTRSEKNWLHEIQDMSPKAKLTPAEKEKLTRYVLSFREAYTSTD